MDKTISRIQARLRRPLGGQDLTLRLLYFLFYSSGVSISSFFSVYLLQAGLSGLQIGALSGIGPVVTLVSQPLWGLLADLRGRRRTLLTAMFISSALVLGYAWPGGFGFLFAWAILHNLFSSPISPLIDSLVLDHLQARPGTSFGQVRLWGAVGWAVGAFVVGRAIAGRDIRLIFAFAAGYMLLSTVVVWRGTGDGGRRVALGRTWRGAGALLRNRPLATILVLIVLLQLGAAGIWSFHGIYMTQLGAPRPLIGLAITVRGLSELPLFLASAWLIRRFGSRRTLPFTFFVFAARALLYGVIRNPALAVVVEASHGLSFSLFLVSAVDYVHRHVPPEWRATGQSLYTAAFFGAGSIIGNAWAGYLYDRAGVQAMYRLNAAILLAVALAAGVALRGSGLKAQVSAHEHR